MDIVNELEVELMPSLPRIITVDPTGNIARVVRAVVDLAEYACRQVNVPSGAEALEEISYGKNSLIVTALNLEDMSALTLVDQARATFPDIGIVILADADDPEMDMDEQHERNIVYLQRPLEVQQFAQIIFAGMRGEDLFEALRKPASAPSARGADLAPVPKIDIDRAGAILDKLVGELGAISILLIARDNTVLLEKGTANYINREALLEALVPSLLSNMEMREIVGGDATTLQFYDGDQRDLYTLSVGLHHMLCIAYDGERGQREFGMVNRLGRRAALDLIALLGAEAFFVSRAAPRTEPVEDLPRLTMAVRRVHVEEAQEEAPQLVRAAEFSTEDATPELETVMLETLSESDFDPSIFENMQVDLSAAEDLFSLENLGNLAVNIKSKRTISDEEARQLGILGDN